MNINILHSVIIMMLGSKAFDPMMPSSKIFEPNITFIVKNTYSF